MAGYAVQTAVNGGSELLIFVPRAAHAHELSLSCHRTRPPAARICFGEIC